MTETLKDVLDIKTGSVVTVVGAGGKTSTIRYLAQRLDQKQVIVTTTTHFLSFGSFPHREFIIDQFDELAQEIEKSFTADPAQKLVLGRGKLEPAPGMEEARINGLPPEWIDRLKEKYPQAIILIEGDGSACRPIKTPADHEPVVPDSTNLLLPVLGMKALGKEVSRQNCHRVERLLDLVSVQEDDSTYIDDRLIVKILTDKRSYGSFISQVERYIPLLNQVEDSNLKEVEETAQKAVIAGLEKVLLLDTHREEPLQQVVQ